MAEILKIPRRPPIPRLLCLLILVLLSVVSIFSCFMQIFSKYHSSIPVASHQRVRKESSGRSENYESDAETVDLVAAHEQGFNFQQSDVWSHVQSLRQLIPNAAPGVSYHAPIFPGSGFLFATIVGELHEIHAAICDLVLIARLLNATIVLPKIQSIPAVSGGNSKVKSFGYLYDEQHFMTALKGDVRVVKLLPDVFRRKASLQKQPVRTPTRFSSVQFYLDEVLPALTAHGACGLVFAKGGSLQEILPTELVEHQRLRCRVAFHALRFRKEIRDLSAQLVRRLEAQGRPYVVVHFGLERDVLAYHGCAELFQDLQTESIQYQRKKMLISEEIDRDLQIDSQEQRHRGLCPLMPVEVGLLLEAFGFRNDTQLYVAGTEITGGQRLVLPLRSMYPRLDDRFTLTTDQERFALYETNQKVFHDPLVRGSVFANTWKKLFIWGKNRPSGYSDSSQKDWWLSFGECEYGTESFFDSTPEEGETNDIQLLHAALDYAVSLEANTYFPAFDKDRHGHPNIASLIMGHRLYQSASLKTFRPNRSVLSALLDQYPYDHSQERNSWIRAAREVLVDALRPETIVHSSQTAKSELFLAHPFPECTCLNGLSIVANDFSNLSEVGQLFLEGLRTCPARTVSEL